jgi:uncharacterized membrane-anchored protein YitT (DUF2179 family)
MAKTKSILHKIWPWIAITVGSLMAAGGYVVFILPLDMVEGGVTGIGIIMKHLTGLPIVGLTSLAVTIVVFFIATRILGRGFGAKSIYATILMNVSIDMFLILKIKPVTDDILLAAFYGGAIVGTGLGLIYFSGASTGGADAFGQILWKLKRIPIGRTLIVIDLFVLGVATLTFIPLEKIMYSLIFIYIEVQVIDMVMNGLRANQRIMIVTDQPDKMKAAIFTSLNRGLTIFKGTGGYTGAERYMLTTVVNKKQVPEIRRIVSEVDKSSFVIIQDIHQVYGEGFEPLPPTRDKRKTDPKAIEG